MRKKHFGMWEREEDEKKKEMKDKKYEIRKNE